MRTGSSLLITAFAVLSLNMSTQHTLEAAHPDQSHYFVYIGTYGKGVYAFRFDANASKIEPLGMVGAVVNPSFLATDRDYRNLYAVSELQGKAEGAVASFSINRGDGSLKPLNTRPAGGEAPCHLAVDHTGKTLVVANYGTGGVSSYPIEKDGSLGPMASLMTAKGTSVNKERQEGPHAHETVISADNKRVYVPDLGLDHIRIYRLDAATAQLTPNDPPFGQVEPGRGPRHLAFSHDEKYVYVLNEIQPFVTVFRHDASSGALDKIQSAETIPHDFSGENSGAEIVLGRSGKYLYTSNRGHDSLQVFAIDPGNGTIRRIQIISTGGKTPRGFAIDPTGQFLFAGNQDSNQVTIFKVNRETGELTDSGQKFEVPSPVDVLFVPAK
jgi:6-phosphogluconolactonase